MGKTYLLSINGKNEGPFKESELTGKFLRGEIEETAQLCAVGGNAWESVSDLLRKSATRKRLTAVILGVALCSLAAWCGYRFNLFLYAERRAAPVIAELEDEVLKKNNDELWARIAKLTPEQQREMEQVMKDGAKEDQEKKAKWIGLRSEFQRKQLVYGTGGGVAVALGAFLFVIGLRTRTVSRPKLPGVPSAPPTPNPTSKKPVAQTPAQATPTNPVAPQSSPKSMPKEPKALCSACQQKVAFPKEMTGQQINCPACGGSMNLDDCSESLA